jgi:hypothetical protein
MKKYKMNWGHFLFMVVMWSFTIVFMIFLYANRTVTTELDPGYKIAPSDEEVRAIEFGESCDCAYDSLAIESP